MSWLLHGARGLVYAIAGGLLFIFLLNRYIIRLHTNPWKLPAIFGVLLGLVGGGGVAGLLLPVKPWLGLPIAVLILMAAGEAGRLAPGRRSRASPPVDSVPHQVPLLRPVTTLDLIVHRYSITLDRWKGGPLRVVHLSDLHATTRLPAEYYAQVFDVAQEANPDIVLLTGDFITDADGLPALAKVFRPVGKLGDFAVFGNHDHWSGVVGQVKALLRGAGVRLVADAPVTLDAAGARVAIAGSDSPWDGSSPVVPASEAGALRFFLSHTPDNVYRAVRGGVDCIFAGHIHGGQFRLPLFGPLVVPSMYGRRFDHGHFLIRGTHLFVAAGVGVASPAIRLYCQPDIFVVDINPS
jgi:predicted MPP superfamily phosphohydrolase